MLKKTIKKYITKYNNYSIVVKASIWYFICSFLQKGISVISTPVFTRLLSTCEYGRYTLYTTWSDVFSIFITFGLASSVYQKKLIELDCDKEKDRFTSALLFLSLILAALSFCLYFPLRYWISDLINLEVKFTGSIYLSTVMITAFNFWAMRQRVDYKYKSLIFITLIITILKPLLGIICILKFPEHKIEARIFSLVAVETMGYSYLLFTQLKRGRHYIDRRYWKYALMYVLPLIPHYLSQRILNQSDRVMIEVMVNTSSAGIYGLAYSAGTILNMLITPSEGTLAPWIYSKIKSKQFKRIYDVTRYPVMALFLICAMFMSVSPEVIMIFAPPEYYSGIKLMPAFISTTYCMLIYTLFIFFEYFYEKTSFIMTATVLSALLNIILNYLFIKLFGFTAAAYTSLVCYILYTCAHYMVLRKICRENNIYENIYDIKLITILGGVLLIYGLILQFIYDYIFIRYFWILGVCSLTYIRRKEILDKLKKIRSY